MAAAASRSNPWIVAGALLAALLALASILLRPPVVGLADNGDYIRVMGYAGFDHSTEAWGDRYLSFLRTTYRVLPVGWFRSGYLSSEIPLALAARFVGLALGRGGLFDLRTMGAVHVGLLLLGMGLILRACRELEPAAQILGAALLVFFFTDVGYVAPFNSFYSQTASLLFLMLAAGVAAEAIRRGGLEGPWRTAAYFLCAAAFVTSKPQEAIQGPVLALLGVRLAAGLAGRRSRRAAVALAIGLCALSLWYGRRAPVSLREAALYQVVFAEVLPHSPDPAADAAALGLDPDWLRYSGTNAFQADTPLRDSVFRVRFLEAIGYRKIVGFYARHPRRFAERVRRISQKLWTLRPSYGNLEKSEAHPTRTLTDRGSAWSRWRLRLFGAQPVASLALLLGGNAAWCLATYRRATLRGRLLRETILAAAVMSATAFVVCLVTNAPPDFSRVFYSGEALCDLLIVADAAWVVQAIAAERAA